MVMRSRCVKAYISVSTFWFVGAGVEAPEPDRARATLASAIDDVAHLGRVGHDEYSGTAFTRGWLFAHVVTQLRIPGPYVELGVQRGWFSYEFLKHLRRLHNHTSSAARYYLVDTWRFAPPKQRYWRKENVATVADPVNSPNRMQQENMKATVDAVSRFWRQVSVLQLSSSEAVGLFMDGGLGFVYVDARHDYCAVREDLLLYWPKLAPGGILAGDDFDDDDWPWCENGTYVRNGVEKAVSEFATDHGLQLFVLDGQWMVQRPLSLHA